MEASAADPALRRYFLDLTRVGARVLDRLALPDEPQPLDHILGRLKPELERQRAETAAVAALGRPPVERGPPVLGVGLNSVGMLADRLTILIVKEWCLRHKGRRDAAAADRLFAEQTTDIADALALARPGSSAMNSKITARQAAATATDWADAFTGLLATNILLWEAQEILYIRDIAALPADELRAYIAWFSAGNIERNQYIQLCEELYWVPNA